MPGDPTTPVGVKKQRCLTRAHVATNGGGKTRPQQTPGWVASMLKHPEGVEVFFNFTLLCMKTFRIAGTPVLLWCSTY